MKQKKISTENRTVDGLYKGTLFVRTVHDYNQLIWSVSIIAIAIVMIMSIRIDQGYFYLAPLGLVVMLTLAIFCLMAVLISYHHEKRLAIAKDLMLLRKAVREYGFGDSDCLFYVKPKSKEDWITILRDSYEYAQTYAYKDDDAYLSSLADFAHAMLKRKFLI